MCDMHKLNDQDDAISIILSNRCYLYSLLQHTFGHEPNLKLLEIVSSEHSHEALGLLLDENESVPHLELLRDLSQEISTNAEGLLDRLITEYTYLLIGPGKLPAPPWESVYVTKERLIFTESTIKVRSAYLEYQFLPANYPHEADDHIAIELDFMLRLSKLSLEHFENGNTKKFEKVLSDQKVFLEEHLLNWVGDFANQIQSSKTHYFYPQMASLALWILRNDYAVLKELLSLNERNKEER